MISPEVERRLNLFGYSMWLVGCVLFTVAAWRSRDLMSLAASILFLVGVVVLMVPLRSR